MNTFLQTVAAGLTIAAVAGIVSCAFLRPKLFMGLYIHLQLACLIALAFGSGLAAGGALEIDGITRTGIWLALGAAAASAVLIFVLAPVAHEQANQQAQEEQARPQNPSFDG